MDTKEPAGAPRAEPQLPDRVQCPTCCRMAPITSRSMGLWFFECELCLTTGAVPEPVMAVETTEAVETADAIETAEAIKTTDL